jgi:hypothetical protein
VQSQNAWVGAQSAAPNFVLQYKTILTIDAEVIVIIITIIIIIAIIII